MLCLVVLETCAYTELLWLLFCGCSVFFSFFTMGQCKGFEGSVGFTTLAHLSLSLLLLLEWWFYSLYLMDVVSLAMLQLVTHYGVSFWLTVSSFAVSIVASNVSVWISSPESPYQLAKLYAMPLSPRSRRRRWSPRGTDVADIDSVDETTPELPMDPLKCPANYNV